MSCVVWMTSGADKQKKLCALCPVLYCAPLCSYNPSVLIIYLMVCRLGTTKPLCALCPVAYIIHNIIMHKSIMYGR